MGYSGLQWVTNSRLQWITIGYNRLQWFTVGYNGLQLQ